MCRNNENKTAFSNSDYAKYNNYFNKSAKSLQKLQKKIHIENQESC